MEGLLSPEAVSELLGIRLCTVHDLVRRGQLACIQVTAKKRLFRHEHVEHFLRTHEREPRAKPVDANRAARVTLPPKASA